MRLRDVPKLKNGDIITCNCTGCGCDGREYVVEVVQLACGCVHYKHEDNGWSFARWYKPNCGSHTPLGLHWRIDIDPSKIKMVRGAQL